MNPRVIQIVLVLRLWGRGSLYEFYVSSVYLNIIEVDPWGQSKLVLISGNLAVYEKITSHY